MEAFMRSNSNSNNAENKENINSNTQQARPAESTKSNGSGSGSGNRIGANGVILGPDGKPCKACNSLKAFGAVATSGSGGGSKGKGRAATTVAAAPAAGAIALTAKESIDPYRDCPADVEQLGRHTWTFLHSTAAYYPDSPSEQHKRNAFSLFSSLPSLYPCRHCAGELAVEMKKIGPPDVSSRLGISNWLCRIHNEVNERLGKREFDCSKVLQRWKEGWEDGHCD